MPKNKRAVITPLYAFLTVTSLAMLSVAFFVVNSTKSKIDGSYDNSKKVAIFNGKNFQVPAEIAQSKLNNEELALDIPEDTTSNVLGSSSKKEKRIEIDLSKQKLYAYEGDKEKMSFDVSTGKWNLTPTGEFRIWTKLKYTLMAGGSKQYGTYYYLPNVPYTMYFYGSYGIHGAYWHDNFGHPMSHGCVNMRIEDSEKLFNWANPVLASDKNSVLSTTDNEGTKVVIYGTAPKE